MFVLNANQNFSSILQKNLVFVLTKLSVLTTTVKIVKIIYLDSIFKAVQFARLKQHVAVASLVFFYQKKLIFVKNVQDTYPDALIAVMHGLVILVTS